MDEHTIGRSLTHLSPTTLCMPHNKLDLQNCPRETIFPVRDHVQLWPWILCMTFIIRSVDLNPSLSLNSLKVTTQVSVADKQTHRPNYFSLRWQGHKRKYNRMLTLLWCITMPPRSKIGRGVFGFSLYLCLSSTETFVKFESFLHVVSWNVCTIDKGQGHKSRTTTEHDLNIGIVFHN